MANDKALKAQELRKRVGNTEQNYCEKCKKQTPHIWIEEKSRGIDHFILNCRECGTKVEVYQY
jgi:NAD-dependent SIR2 family protein deacetylase